MRLLNATGDEVWRLRRWSEDEQGKRHYRMTQHIGGLEVVGGEIIIHADASTGAIEALDAQFLPSRGLPSAPLMPASAVSFVISSQYGSASKLTEEPWLSYLRTPAGKGYLVWRSRVSYTDKEGAELVDDVFVDAVSSELIERHPLVESALSRWIYTAGNTTNLPGTLLISEGGSSANTGAQATYNYAGNTYNYYWNTHARTRLLEWLRG